DVTLLVATGCHRGTTKDELRAKVGDGIVDREKIAVHDCDDPSCVYLGDLPSGAHFYVNKLAAETDLLVAEGFIEPHFFAGFSGGRKSVLPGICARKTVLGNHCGAFIDDPHARTGVLDGNPIHADMDRAAEIAKLAFIVNVVIDEEKHTVAAFAGNYRSAHRRGVDFLMRFCGVRAVPGDIVVTSNGGAPLDQNLYQCVKCMTAAEASCRPGGTIIALGECADGVGGDYFYRQLKECETPRQLYDDLTATPMEETEPDQWQSQILVRILDHYRVIMVTRPELRETVESMKMTYAESLEEALEMAGEGEVTWIPNGVSLVVTGQ
ncbi:MAG: nickel-dependent lactate racemase, partial [Lachnospiraceae bacterium]|nr:nickel-dependent lactate racemase [Lachnospiraceae bacterium]